MTPLLWYTFLMLTVDMPPFSSVNTSLEPFIMAVKVPPLTVFNAAFPPPALISAAMALASSLPATTWYVSILVNVALFSGFTRLSTVPLGSLAKAASVGANTVKGPALSFR